MQQEMSIAINFSFKFRLQLLSKIQVPNLAFLQSSTMNILYVVGSVEL